MKKITVVIDMQNDFLTGTLANPSAVSIIPSVLNEIKNADYVMYTRDTHKENHYFGTQEGKNLPVLHCVAGSTGWQIVNELDPLNIPEIKSWFIVDKPTFGYVNIWNSGKFAQIINENGQENVEVTFCGTCTDICVVSNAMIVKALYPEIIINVKADACAGLTPEKHQSALDAMSSCQINII